MRYNTLIINMYLNEKVEIVYGLTTGNDFSFQK